MSERMLGSFYDFNEGMETAQRAGGGDTVTDDGTFQDITTKSARIQATWEDWRE